MGLNNAKALSLIGGQNAIDFSAEKISRLFPNKLFITLPNNLLMNENIRITVEKHNAEIRPNRFAHLGLLGSIKSILIEAYKNMDGLLITPVDSPIFSKRMIEAMINLATIYRHRPLIVIPHFYWRPGHPIYFSNDFFDDLMSAQGENARLSSFVEYSRRFIYALFWADAKILVNLNTVDDWQRIDDHSIKPSMRIGDKAASDAPMANFS
jgi:CTP:molybdopterin cytidylyltransferase MocA